MILERHAVRNSKSAFDIPKKKKTSKQQEVKLKLVHSIVLQCMLFNTKLCHTSPDYPGDRVDMLQIYSPVWVLPVSRLYLNNLAQHRWEVQSVKVPGKC